MQGQMQYGQYHFKTLVQGQPKGIDKSNPTISLKHVNSNPNISLDNNSKSLFYSSPLEHRNLPVTQPVSNVQSRHRHGDLAKSLFLPQQSQVEVPE